MCDVANKQWMLIEVDVQNCFCPKGELPVAHGDEVIAPLNRVKQIVLARGGKVAASRDWHPAKTRHFAAFGGVWPVHGVAGTFGAQFHADLDLSGVTIFSKGTGEDEDAYSAFDGISESGETLAAFLGNPAEVIVLVGGLATDYCVKETVRAARVLGYQTYLIEDACRAVNIQAGDGEAAISAMMKTGTFRITSAELAARCAA